MSTTLYYRTAFSIVALLLALHPVSIAQNAGKISELQGAQAQYDMGSGSSMVDGRLRVSNGNGSVYYTYPLSSQSLDGHSVSATLSYSGGVPTTSYLRYFSSYDTDTSSAVHNVAMWAKFTQNRPAWIYGINGFAIEVISSARHFHIDPHTNFQSTRSTKYTDQDFLWTIDGYDVGNRMLNFYNPDARNVFGGYKLVDVIKLLRSDGTVLRLQNVQYIGQASSADSARFYTGHYFENEINASGYAIVSFDSTYWPSHIKRYAPTNDPALVPRIVRYFPGDGLEYVFRERVAPFGLFVFNNDTTFGGKYASPTIFYLEQIKTESGAAVDVRRARHYSSFKERFGNREIQDSTKGRAQSTGATGILITHDHWNDAYLESHIFHTVEVLGRTYKIQIDTTTTSGNNGSLISGTYADYPDYYSGSTSSTLAAQYGSATGYVTAIIDPSGRRTSFTYERYLTKYAGYGFAGVDSVELTNFRLTEVKEPDARYTITYKKGTSVVRPDSTYLPYLISNVADTVRKYGPDNVLQTTTRYAITYKPIPGFPKEYSVDSCQVFSSDNVSGRFAKTTYYYKPYVNTDTALVSDIPRPRFTSLYKVVGTVDSITTISYTQYGDSLASDYAMLWGTPYVILPTASWTTVNGRRTSYARFNYAMTTARDFGGDSFTAGKVGKEIATKVTTIYRPDDTTAVLLRDTTTFLHLPLVYSNVSRSDTVWDDAATRASFGTQERVNNWYKYAFVDSLNIKKVVSTSYKWIPPIFGLPLTSRLYDGAGRFLGGRKAVYDTNAYTQVIRRGRILADSIISRDGSKTVLGASYGYDRVLGRNVLSKLTSRFGATGNVYHDYHLPWLLNGSSYDKPGYSVTTNQNTKRSYELDPSGIFPYFYEQPTASAAIVRKYGPSGAIYPDTIRTVQDFTYFGNVSRVIDPNGNIAAMTYDGIGRTTRANLPFDFSDDSSDYSGTRDLLASQAHTLFQTEEDSINCDTKGFFRWYPTAEAEFDKFYAAAPVFEKQHCVGDGYPQGAPTILKSVTTGSYARYTSKAEHYAFLKIQFPSGPNCAGAQSLDSARIRLWVTSISKASLMITVKIPKLGLDRQYVFRIPRVGRFKEGSGGVQGKASREGKDTRSVLMAGGDTSYVIYPFDIDLTSLKDSLLTFSSSKSLDMEIHVITADGMITFANEAEDDMPKLILKGSFRELRPIEERDKDYTASVGYDDAKRVTTSVGKLDDGGHTSNVLASGSLDNGARRTRAQVSTGIHGVPTQARDYIGNPASPIRIDTVSARYSGDGSPISATSVEHDSVVLEYDAIGRPIRAINVDGTKRSLRYYLGTPSACGIQDTTQNFYGFCSATVSVDEVGRKVASYYDVFGRLRRVVADSSSGGLKLTTKFEYDVLGRTTLVINPRGDSITYWYDDFGRVKYVKHPDFGIGSMAYDDLGNLRFSQTREQATLGRMTFNEYDDLNRLTLVGEATFPPPNTGGGVSVEPGLRVQRRPKDNGRSQLASLPGDPNYHRMSDSLDPNILHDLGMSSILTANVTIYQLPLVSLPQVWRWDSLAQSSCTLSPDLHAGETSAPTGPLLRHATTSYSPITTPRASATDFEQVSKYPYFVRTVINYDTLPTSIGSVWEKFPAITRWDSLAPAGKVRNLKGRSAAVAYREHGGEPFHYVVTSYDARGRVEALLRWTANLGFDAVYYTYNSSDLVNSVRTVDPLRQHTTWYGYDHNGRVDSIWTSLSSSGTGLGVTNPQYPTPATRPLNADVVYVYNRSSQVDSMKYPPVGVVVDYAYNRRRWLDSMIATKSGSEVFRELLSYDSTGMILKQSSKHASLSDLQQLYTYDSVGRLVKWSNGTDTTRYTYDQVGNRKKDTTGPATTAYNYATAADGPDRLIEKEDRNGGAIAGRRTYSYDGDGAVTGVKKYDSTNALSSEESYAYSWRGLTRQYIAGHPLFPTHKEWSYRYGPGGEREEKRLMVAPGGDSSGNVLSWTYYLNGLGNAQLALYHGQQTIDTTCGDSGRRVYLYPTEYLTYGVGTGTNVVTYPNGSKDYKIFDHQGSTRLSYSTFGALSGRYDYEPFGEVVTGVPPRQGYIDKEVDRESGLGDYGVRKYSQEEGRFRSIDPLWGANLAGSPYTYAGNSPLVFVDPSGFIYTSPAGDNPLDPTPHDNGGGGGDMLPFDPIEIERYDDPVSTGPMGGPLLTNVPPYNFELTPGQLQLIQSLKNIKPPSGSERYPSRKASEVDLSVEAADALLTLGTGLLKVGVGYVLLSTGILSPIGAANMVSGGVDVVLSTIRLYHVANGEVWDGPGNTGEFLIRPFTNDPVISAAAGIGVDFALSSSAGVLRNAFKVQRAVKGTLLTEKWFLRAEKVADHAATKWTQNGILGYKLFPVSGSTPLDRWPTSMSKDNTGYQDPRLRLIWK